MQWVWGCIIAAVALKWRFPIEIVFREIDKGREHSWNSEQLLETAALKTVPGANKHDAVCESARPWLCLKSGRDRDSLKSSCGVSTQVISHARGTIT